MKRQKRASKLNVKKWEVPKEITAMAQAISGLFYPYAEVVVHDVGRDSIVSIFNPLSRRKEGDPSYLDKELLETGKENIGPYQRTNWDGRTLKCMSTVIRDSEHNIRGFVCINLDISACISIQDALSTFLGSEPQMSEGSSRFYKENLYQRINEYVKKFCQERRLHQQHLTRDEKRDLILSLKEEGAFDEKNAATYVARALDVSRATVYNYLGEIHK
jgi:predicted transcriptional regulator YheO